MPAFDEGARTRALEHHAALAKPAGSLGRLEELAAFYAGAHGCFPPPAPERPTLALFAADHGVTAEGVSAFPSSVTAAVVANIGAGGSAVNALSRSLGLELCLVDVGLQGKLPALFQQSAVRVHARPVSPGTQNLALGPAMTLEQAEKALLIGAETANELADSGSRLLGVGEIGIGNTTSAAAIVAFCTGSKAETVVGPGAGLDA
ncbi:MAG TPA: nicotinate-nucleotide--dimethylbenzimidazole phosphoribosyltransferase, partial [Polyangiaceae bacterium]|nr:nicotinate-nucleotide--dimethylbenzimidazole phosphoribosyltransferase [Polyangiaceae bacterium]